MSKPDGMYAHDVNAADAVIRKIVAMCGDRPNGVHDWRTERDIIASAIQAERIAATEKERERAAKCCEGNFDSEMAGYGNHFAAAIRSGE